ncbi:MAG: amidohydrolase family protein [Gemmatimonadetes bacterium]|nr:amidohydrolase family protein [Gemmatimonadota bacterium]
MKVALDLTPRQLITAATLNGARTIGRERDCGTIEAGKYASLVFVRRNPLVEVANLRTVVTTVNGEVVFASGVPQE